MNLYRLLFVNKHDSKLIHRDKLYELLNNATEFTNSDLNQIRSYRGLESQTDSKLIDVRTLSKKGFAATDLNLKFRSLMRIKGVGKILASEMLAFQNPYKCAAISHKVWNRLVQEFGFETEEKEKDDDFSVKDYVIYLKQIQSLASEYGMKPADVEFVLDNF